MDHLKHPRGASFFHGLFSWIFSRSLKYATIITHRPLTSFVIAIVTIFLSILVKQAIVYALSEDFIQTDWSGGADTVNTADETNLTNWTKYYSKDSHVDTDTAGEIKLKLEISQP